MSNRILKYILIAICYLVTVFGCATGIPKIQFDTLTYSFNTINLNQKFTYKFKFKNVGNGDLMIRELKTSCDCAAAKSTEKPIPPNGEGEIIATMSTGSTVGEKMENIFVYTNDTGHSIIELSITAWVISEISMNPSSLNFPELKYGHETTQNIVLKSLKRDNLKILKIESSSPYISAKVNPYQNVKSDEGLVTISISSALPIGVFSGSIKILTNSKIIPSLDLPISGEVIGDIIVSPDRIFFGLVKKGIKITRTITITAPEKLNFSIFKMETSVKGLTLQLETLQKGTKYKINATLDTSLSDKRISNKVILHTNVSYLSNLNIPVYGFVQ